MFVSGGGFWVTMSLSAKNRACMRKTVENMLVSGLEEFHDSMRRKDDLLTIFRKDAAQMCNASFEYST